MKKSDVCFIGAVICGISFAFPTNPLIAVPFLVCGFGMLYFRRKE